VSLNHALKANGMAPHLHFVMTVLSLSHSRRLRSLPSRFFQLPFHEYPPCYLYGQDYFLEPPLQIQVYLNRNAYTISLLCFDTPRERPKTYFVLRLPWKRAIATSIDDYQTTVTISVFNNNANLLISRGN